jgi:hypothetical protein
MNLEDTLKKAAYKVWDELEPIPTTPSYKVFEVREEALTTMLIKEIFRANCSDIEKIEMIPGNEESLRGYDFELAIGSRAKGKYVRLFVQAKTLKGKRVGSTYNEIDFDQTNTLINYSRTQSSLAIYAFYNHLVENDLILRNHYNSATPYDKKSLGITLASAYSIHMLCSKKFSDYHFNNGHRINPQIYSLRYFSHLFYFHEASKSHLSVPFHELSYFTIDLAKRINMLYRRIKARSRTNFFFFFYPGMDSFLFDDKEIIPIISTNKEKLISEFKSRVEPYNEKPGIYNPQFLLIVNTDEQLE